MTSSSSAQFGFVHDHPVMMALLPLGAGALIIGAFILLRWYMNKSAWPFHPGGQKGFLYDEFLRLGAIFIPFALMMVGLRWYAYAVDPTLLASPWMIAVVLSVFVFRRVSAYIPPIRDAAKRIDTARDAAREARVAA